MKLKVFQLTIILLCHLHVFTFFLSLQKSPFLRNDFSEIQKHWKFPHDSSPETSPHPKLSWQRESNTNKKISYIFIFSPHLFPFRNQKLILISIIIILIIYHILYIKKNNLYTHHITFNAFFSDTIYIFWKNEEALRWNLTNWKKNSHFIIHLTNKFQNLICLFWIGNTRLSMALATFEKYYFQRWNWDWGAPPVTFFLLSQNILPKYIYRN